MKFVRFSVVIPHYNSITRLRASVDSVLMQSLSPVEVIIVDDASAVDQRPDAIYWNGIHGLRVLQLDTNCGGPAGPRNRGVEAAIGDYVAFLDSDDIWSRDHLEVLGNAIQKTEATLIGSTIRNFDDSAALPDLRKSKQLQHVGPSRVMIKSPFATSATAVRRDIVEEFRFDESPKMRAVEDIDLWQRIVLSGYRAVKLRAETVWYLKNPEGISAGKKKHLIKIYRVIQKNDGFPGETKHGVSHQFRTCIRFIGYCVKSFCLRVVWQRL